VLRQFRVEKHKCDLENSLFKLLSKSNCYKRFASDTEDKTTYGNGSFVYTEPTTSKYFTTWMGVKIPHDGGWQFLVETFLIVRVYFKARF
jgi:hypothetical protein